MRVGGKLRAACKKCINKKNMLSHIDNKLVRNAMMRAHYQENKEAYRKRHAEYSRTEHGKKIARCWFKRIS